MFHYGYYFKHINIEINKYIQQHLQTLDLTKPQMDILLSCINTRIILSP